MTCGILQTDERLLGARCSRGGGRASREAEGARSDCRGEVSAVQVLNETGVRDPGRRSLVARDGGVLVPESVFVPGGVVA